MTRAKERAESMRVVLDRIQGAEIVHYASGNTLLTSHAHVIHWQPDKDNVRTYRFPTPGWQRFFLPFRFFRRGLRLDKCVVVPVEEGGEWTGLIAIRWGTVYHIDLKTNHMVPTLRLRQSHVPLHMSVCRSGSGYFFQGEYGGNPERVSVPIYRCTDGGRSWETIYEIPKGKARHIHACCWDPYDQKVWVCTGDFEGESHLLIADEDFAEIKWIGDGTQCWRTCGLFFTKDAVIWAMDSQLETSFICRYDRKIQVMEQVFELPGPVWYSKALNDGWFLVACAVEKGPGVHDNHARIWASKDCVHWYEVFRASKDMLLMPQLKNGVIAFSDGNQTSEHFHLSAEALSNMDGRAFQARMDAS